MRIERIKQKLQQKFQPEILELVDKSALHQGHFQGGGDETHLALKIAAQEFKKISLVESHRMINQLLADEFEKGLHAIEIRIIKNS